MNLDDFINKYNGKQITDPWNGFLGECVSLWKRYAQEVQGVDPADLYVPDGRAKNIWYQFTPAMAKHYTKSNSPQRGDAAIYDGAYGDVAIVISPTQVFGQLGTPVFKPAATRGIGSPIGFIRKKGANMQPITPNELNDLCGALWGVQADPNHHKNWDGKPFYEAYKATYDDGRTFAYADKCYKAIHAQPANATELKSGLYQVK